MVIYEDSNPNLRSSGSSSLKMDISATLLLILIWIFVVFQSFSEKVNSAVFPDNESMTNSLLSFMSGAIKSNSWPFWSDSLWGGLTLYNQPQLTPYYPFYFLKFANYSGTLNSMRTIHLIVLLHVLIFLLTSYFLLRILRISQPISVAGALVMVVNSNTLGILSWVTAIATIAWIPLLIAGLILIFRDKRKIGFYVYFTAVLLIASASPSHRLIFGFYLSVIFLIYYYLQVQKNKKYLWIRSLLRDALLPTSIFLAIFIPIFMPFFVDTPNLIRWIGDPPPGYIIGDSKIPYANFTQLQLSTSQIFDIFMKPSDFNAIGNVHIGIFAFIIFCVSTYFGFKLKIYRLFLGLGLYSLLSAFGSSLGLSILNYQIPFINKIREPIQYLAYWHICVGVCIALGMQQLIDSRSSTNLPIKRRKRLASKDYGVVYNPKVLPLLFLTITFTFQYLNTPWQMNLAENSTYRTEKQFELNRVFDRIIQLDPKREYRTIFDQTINSQVAGGLASFKKIRTLQSYLNPAPIDLFEKMFAYDNNGPNYVNSLGVRFGICKGCNDVFADGNKTFENFEFLESINNYSIFINEKAFPYVFLIDGYQGVIKTRFDIDARLPADYSSNLFAMLDSNTERPVGISQSSNPNFCEIRALETSYNRREFLSRCESNSIMVLNEHFTKNWRVRVDGKKVTTITVNDSLLGAMIPKGTRELNLEYFPTTLENSIKVSLFITIMSISFVLHTFWQRKRKINRR
jgi:hypothetical protein